MPRAAPPPTAPATAADDSDSGSQWQGYEDGYAEDDEPCPRPQAPFSLLHEEKMRRLHENWLLAMPAIRQEMIHRAPLLQQYQAAMRDMMLACIQQRLDAAWQLHKCCHLSDGSCSMACLTPGTQRPVTYWSLTCHGTLQVPSYTCSTCSSIFSPSPVQAGCFPSSPVLANIWYDLMFLEAYVPLSLQLGVSGTGAGCVMTRQAWCSSCLV